MDSIEVSTVVYVRPEEIYEFLLDFPRYAEYSKHLREVRRAGEGGSGTNYHITFAWWRLSYTAVSEVTEVDPPTRIDWRLVEDIEARGYWLVEPEPESAPEGEDHASRVRLFVEFAPESADERLLDLPRFVSLDWLIDRVKPKVKREAERIVQRIVADLEGQSRQVALTIHTAPDSV
ncbi:MAG: type II toxin-antitoxin system RatA family toxin [Salinirussus sp.]